MEIIGVLLTTLLAVLIIQQSSKPRDSDDAAEKRLFRYSNGISVVVPFRLENSRSSDSAAAGISIDWVRTRKVYARVTLDSRRPFVLGWWDENLLGPFTMFVHQAQAHARIGASGRLEWIARTSDGSPLRLLIRKNDLDLLSKAAEFAGGQGESEGMWLI